MTRDPPSSPSSRSRSRQRPSPRRVRRTKPPPRGAWTGVHEYGHVNNINRAARLATRRSGDGLKRRQSKQGAIIYNGHAGLGANARANIVTDNKDPDKLRAVRTRANGVIASVNVKYT